MTTFLRLLTEKNKATSLLTTCAAIREGKYETRVFHLPPESFSAVPGSPFAYWIEQSIREVFSQGYPILEAKGRDVQSGATSGDDFRFLRLSWEIAAATKAASRADTSRGKVWVTIPKGGSFSSFFSEWPLVVNWRSNGIEIKEFVAEYRGKKGWGYNWTAALNGHSQYFRPGITWPRRTTSGLSMRVMPAGCIFADKGPAIFSDGDHTKSLLAILALVSSKPFAMLVGVRLAAADAAARSYEVGIVETTPFPDIGELECEKLARLAKLAWSIKRTFQSTDETSSMFLLPIVLRPRLGDYYPTAMEAELALIQSEIDTVAFDLYGLSGTNCQASRIKTSNEGAEGDNAEDVKDDDVEAEVPSVDAVLSWSVGVAFGRFDWRLATGDRQAPPEPAPFDPLPVQSPGMLPDDFDPFHAHAGILVDDQGHLHDLARIVEEVLAHVDVAASDDVRRWLQRAFFSFHLKRYSKSRRKAPIYWPLATSSGNYTLWVYYPSLSSQTLYTAINDFIEPKLNQVGSDVAALRNKGAARSRHDEKQFEPLQALELELIELRDTLLKLAPTYKPNHDDGVQISAAPLWPLFLHKLWQKVLKDTWVKLEKGDYDWAHLAMNYWPERVREKCQTDKSLAIAHSLEDFYDKPEAKLKNARGKNEGGS